MVFSLSHANKICFKNGLITFEADEKYENAIGWAKGLYPTVLKGTADYVFHHEVVHVIQNLQISSVSVYEPLIKHRQNKNGQTRFFNFEGFRLDILGVANDLTASLMDYSDRWKEVEAFHFASSVK